MSADEDVDAFASDNDREAENNPTLALLAEAEATQNTIAAHWITAGE
jgi:hypothetical protein